MAGEINMSKENAYINMWAKIVVFLGLVQLAAIVAVRALTTSGQDLPLEWYLVPTLIIVGGLFFAWLTRPRK